MNRTVGTGALATALVLELSLTPANPTSVNGLDAEALIVTAASPRTDSQRRTS
jgi:hypothetical protein